MPCGPRSTDHSSRSCPSSAAAQTAAPVRLPRGGRNQRGWTPPAAASIARAQGRAGDGSGPRTSRPGPGGSRCDAELMASGDHRSDQIRMPAGVPAHHVEGGLHVLLGQHLQDRGRQLRVGTVIEGQRGQRGGRRHRPHHATLAEGTRPAPRAGGADQITRPRLALPFDTHRDPAGGDARHAGRRAGQEAPSADHGVSATPGSRIARTWLPCPRPTFLPSCYDSTNPTMAPVRAG
jgi:hypothetical protein